MSRSTFTSRLRAYVELARLSNLPTCVSNVLVGCAIGGRLGDTVPIETIIVLAMAIALLYVGGMALNDLIDLEVDRRDRADRPLPSGRVSKRGAWAFVVITMGVGAAIIALHGIVPLIFATALIVCIVGYDLLHRSAPASVVLMGMCRGLVYWVAAASVAWPLDWLTISALSAAMTTYIVMLTIIARVESRLAIGARRWLTFLLPGIIVAPLLVPHDGAVIWVTSMAVLAVLWLVVSARHAFVEPPRVRHAVMGWLSGVCLVDAFYLAILNQPTPAMIALVCFAVTVAGHRYILGS